MQHPRVAPLVGSFPMGFIRLLLFNMPALPLVGHHHLVGLVYIVSMRPQSGGITDLIAIKINMRVEGHFTKGFRPRENKILHHHRGGEWLVYFWLKASI